MRKDSLRVINEVIEDVIGGLYNAMLDDIREEFERFTKENFLDKVSEIIYLDSIREEDNVRFEGKESMKAYIIGKLVNDNDVKEIIDYI